MNCLDSLLVEKRKKKHFLSDFGKMTLLLCQITPLFTGSGTQASPAIYFKVISFDPAYTFAFSSISNLFVATYSKNFQADKIQLFLTIQP